MTIAERRRAPRYPVCLPIQVTLLDHRGQQMKGETCDMSSLGVLFKSQEPVAVGSSVEYTINLGTHPPVQLRCRGKVVRSGVSPSRIPVFLAATLEQYEFVRSPSSVPASEDTVSSLR
ncbi:MAG: PilZ domain-containing protein [Bryobacteraceae bacterium]